MKLYTNKNNSQALKLLISANFAEKSVQPEIVNVDDARFQCPRRLPVLELDTGEHIFSNNSASWYLYPPEQKNSCAADYWLEWEASCLQPVIALYLGATSKADSGVINQLKQLLTSLNSSLNTKFLIGNTVSVADVAVWSTLFPLATEPKCKQELLAEQTQLQAWFSHLQTLTQVQEAVVRLCPKQGLTAFQSVADATWYPVNSVVTQTEKSPRAELLSFTSIDEAVVRLRPKQGLTAFQSVADATWYPVNRVVTQTKKSPRAELLSFTSIDGTTKEAPISEAELQSAVEAWQNGAVRRPKPKHQVTPVLPAAGERNILITSALPYVNNIPHLGTIIGCVLSADVFARFSRLCNYNTLYICGTDEYGTATETKALEEGLSPQEICDKYFKTHEAVYKWFNISFDSFGRTTTPQQTEICQDIFLQLYENGFMTTESVEQLLCEHCNRYLADRFVEGTCPRCAYEDARGDQCDGCGHLVNATELIKPRCKVCQKTPVIRKSEQFFLDLPKIEPLLRKWQDGVIGGWSNNARVITKSWLKDGLKPRCITRDLKWGIPVPVDGFRNKVFYVWFDAPIGYMSITKGYTDQWEKWWRPQKDTAVTLYNFLGKDNVPFHSVMFPSCLLGANRNYTMVSYIMATEFLNYEDEKFSKSRGVGVFGTDAWDTLIPSDVWRFYLLYIRPESQDSNFSWVDLATKNNSELLNNLGNFVNRALVFAKTNFAGLVPEMTLEATEWSLLASINRELKAYITALEGSKLRDGIRHILTISRFGNQYMQMFQPWVLFRGSDADRTRAGTVIGMCCNIICLLAILLKPYMPATSDIMKEQLQTPDNVWVIVPEFTLLLPPGHKLGKPSPLFNKIQLTHVELLKQQFSGRQKSRSPVVAPVSSHIQGDAIAIEKLSAAVAQQAELVRKLKASGSARSIWQPHVAVLLELKQQLAAAELADLEEDIELQEHIVRELRYSCVPMRELCPQVKILQELKSRLAELQQGSSATAKNKK